MIQCLKVLKRYNLEQAPESVKDDRESPSGKFKCSPRTMTLEWGEKTIQVAPKPSRAAGGAPSYSTPPSVAPEPKSPTSADEENPFIRSLLQKTEPLREERKKERLLAFNKKVFSDRYFDSEIGASGAMRGVKPETRAAIEKWMKENGVK